MLRLITAVLTAMALVATPDAARAAASPPPPRASCDPQLDVCEVEVTLPARPAGVRPAPASRRRGPGCQASRGVAFVEVPCTSSAGTWSNALECYLSPYDPPPAPTDPLWQGHTTGAIYLCTTALVPSTRPVWLATPPTGVTPEQLAAQALSTLQVPEPVIRRSPSQANSDNGTPYTWVNLWTWWWTTPATWRPLEATARAGGQWATVTVTPTQMRLDPGDGAPAVTCAGPGRPWTEADADTQPGPDACAHRYTRITRSGPVTATVTVQWAVTWAGSGGSSGSLPDLQTAAASSFVVQQIQVVTR